MTDVCVLSTVHPAHDQRIYHKEIRALADAGYDVTFVVHAGESGVRDGVRIRSLGTTDSRGDRWRHVRDAYRIARDLDADCYHFHDPELLPVGAALARNTAGRVIYDVHEYYPDAIYMREWIPFPIRLPLARAFPPIESGFVRRLDAVITADDPTSRAFRARGHDPVLTLRNFPKTESIEVGDPPLERRHRHVLAYVGQLSRERGLFRMLDIVSLLPETELWAVGGFKNRAVEREARAVVARRGLSDRVTFTGYVEYDRLFSYLAGADCGLALLDRRRTRRNVPTKLFEYLACGLPVVATAGESVVRYLDQETGVFVPEADPETAADRVRALLANGERRAEMGRTGRERVAAKYSWERERERLLGLYESLVGSP
ncbi:glycosyltransferase family 4 protein [Natronorarus salvus]|uniref:glycosyltransferase family 4 protein n=1 Tax=Natronorarus salvus TaxID=3117733 RepID=UPI002F26A2F2